jgi:hypothetical protein
MKHVNAAGYCGRCEPLETEHQRETTRAVKGNSDELEKVLTEFAIYCTTQGTPFGSMPSDVLRLIAKSYQRGKATGARELLGKLPRLEDLPQYEQDKGLKWRGYVDGVNAVKAIITAYIEEQNR